MDDALYTLFKHKWIMLICLCLGMISAAVAYLLDPSLFTVRRGPIRVVCDGIAIGQTIQKPDRKKATPAAWRNRPSQTVCVGVDSQRLLDLYYKTVVGA